MRRINRERLPNRDPSRRQKIDKTVGIRSEIPIMQTTGQRGDVQQDPCTTSIKNTVRLLHLGSPKVISHAPSETAQGHKHLIYKPKGLPSEQNGGADRDRPA